MDKSNFALYLEETASEIRAFTMNHTTLEEICFNLIDKTRAFHKEQEEYACLKLVDK